MNPTRTPLAALALCLAAAAACERKPVVETQPAPIGAPAVKYPEELWESGVEGRTVLRILVTERGTIDSVRVDSPAAFAAFDSAALAATDSLRFTPARRDGKPVPRWVLLPVEFELTPAGAAAPAAAPNAQTP